MSDTTLSKEEIFGKHFKPAKRGSMSDKDISRIYSCMEEYAQAYASTQRADQQQGWARVDSGELPKPVSGEDNSENVFAICNGRLKIMAYCFISGTGPEDSGWAWCDCNGQIDGDPEYDDDYKPTHWMPLPELPQPPQQ